MRFFRLPLLGLLLTTFVLAGCGASKVTVSGQVLYQGKPLPGGILTFLPENTKFNSVAAEIDEEGNYEATLPVGKVMVSVDNRELQPPDQGRRASLNLPPDVMKAIAQKSDKGEAPPAPRGNDSSESNARGQRRGKYVPIPDKYYTAEDSGLEFTVESGTSKHDIELK